MTDDAGEAPPAVEDDPADAAALAAYASALADGIEAALPGWVERQVDRILLAYRGQVDASAARVARAAGQHALTDIGPEVRALLAMDIDAQPTTPLAIVRRAVRYPTQVLVDAGVPPVERDPFAERQFPADVYDLTPATFADLDPALQDAGLTWGAAKAHVHLARRRREGRR